MQYLEASSKLIDELQISTAFNQTLVDRVEANIDNVDSLIVIISDSFYESYKYLQENHQEKLSLLVLAGSWIEALYITTQITIIIKDDQEIVDIIADQKSSLSKLLEIMDPNKNDQTILDIYTGLSGIKVIYDRSSEPFSAKDLEKVIKATESLRKTIV
jgi:hypothetical protein